MSYTAAFQLQELNISEIIQQHVNSEWTRDAFVNGGQRKQPSKIYQKQNGQEAELFTDLS